MESISSQGIIASNIESTCLFDTADSLLHLRAYEQSRALFSSLLKRGITSIENSLVKDKIAIIDILIRQSYHGIYLPEELCTNNSTSIYTQFEDYFYSMKLGVSPGKGRGLFLLQDIEEGGLLIFEKAFAYLSKDDVLEYSTTNNYCITEKTIGNQNEILAMKIMTKTQQCKISRARVSILYDGDTANDECPHIDVFRRDNHPLIDALSMQSISIKQMKRILQTNAYGDINDHSLYLFLVTSLINHSCVPTATQSCSKNGVMEVRAIHGMRRGTEVTLRYSNDEDKLHFWGIKPDNWVAV